MEPGHARLPVSAHPSSSHFGKWVTSCAHQTPLSQPLPHFLYAAASSPEGLQHLSGSGAVLVILVVVLVVLVVAGQPLWCLSNVSLPRLSTTEFRLSHMKLPLFSGQKWLNIGSFRRFNQKTFLKVLNTVLLVHSSCLADIYPLITHRKREPIKWNNIPFSSLLRVKPL